MKKKIITLLVALLALFGLSAGNGNSVSAKAYHAKKAKVVKKHKKSSKKKKRVSHKKRSRKNKKKRVSRKKVKKNKKKKSTKKTNSANNTQSNKEASDKILDPKAVLPADVYEKLTSNNGLGLMSKWDIVTHLTGEQHEAAELLLMDQLGLVDHVGNKNVMLSSRSSFESQMNKISEDAQTMTNDLNGVH